MIPSAPRTIVLGAGRMGTHHLEALRDPTRLHLVGILERDPTRHAELASRHGVPVLASLEALQERVEADASIVATPDETHVPLALECLALGLHALVEKPLAPSAPEAEVLASRFLEAGRVLSVGMVERHNPAWEAFLRNAPLVGNPRFLEIERSSHGARSPRTGVLHDLAIHDLDLLRIWLGEGTAPDPTIGHVDRGRAHLAGSRPFRWTLRAEWTSAPAIRSWILQGDSGSLHLDLSRRTLHLRPGVGEPSEIAIEEGDPLRREHAAFARAIRSDASTEVVSSHRHLGILSLCDALAESLDPSDPRDAQGSSDSVPARIPSARCT